VDKYDIQPKTPSGYIFYDNQILGNKLGNVHRLLSVIFYDGLQCDINLPTKKLHDKALFRVELNTQIEDCEKASNYLKTHTIPRTTLEAHQQDT
jgi:hypothetical protein